MQRLPADAAVRVQTPITLPPRSEPEPDIAVVRRNQDRYRTHHPGPADIHLIIEISDTTLAYDRGIKLALYAAASIPEVWIADLIGRRLFLHRRPSGRVYEDVSVITEGTVAPEAFPELAIRVAEILGTDEPEAAGA